MDKGFVERIECFLVFPQFFKCNAPVEMPQRIARIFCQVPVKGFNSFRKVAGFQERKSQVIEYFGIGGFQFQGPPEYPDGLRELSVDNQRFALVVPCWCKGRQDPDSLVKGRDGITVVAQCCKRQPLVVMGVPVFGIDLQQHLKDMDCPFRPVDLFQREALVVECLNAPLVQPDGIIEGIDCILVPPEIEEAPPAFNPAFLLFRVDPEGFFIREYGLFRLAQLV